jgi:hypothetical protein
MRNAASRCIRRGASFALLALVAFAATVLAPSADSASKKVLSSTAAITVTQASGVSLSISWQRVRSAAGYDAYLDGARVAKTQGTAYTFANLRCGSIYELGVDAFTTKGVSSSIVSLAAQTSACPVSTGGNDTSPPTSPTSVTQSGSTATTISLLWSASLDNVGVAGYDLFLNGNKVGTTAATNYSFANLSCGTSYTLAVDAYDAAGNRSQSAAVGGATSPCAASGPVGPTVNCDLYASPSGSDANLGSLASPFLTVPKLDRSLAPGQTGCLRAGTYGSTTTWTDLSASGTADAPVTLTAYPNETATVAGAVAISGSYVTVTGLKIDGSNSFYSGSLCSPGRSLASPDIEGTNDILDHNEIYQSTIKGNGIGIGFRNGASGDNTIIRYNKIHDVGSCQDYDHLIYAGHGNNIQIYGNWMWNDPHGWGVQLYSSPTNARVYDNVIDGAGAGVTISDNGSMTATGNRVYENIIINQVGVPAPGNITGACIGGSGPVVGSNNSFTNNDCFNNPGGVGGQLNVLVSNNITSDPQLINAAAHDYRLSSSSPLASWGVWDGSQP